MLQITNNLTKLARSQKIHQLGGFIVSLGVSERGIFAETVPYCARIHFLESRLCHRLN
jgi:hypothetical protein